MSTAVMWLLLFVVVALGILIAALSKTKFTTKKIATIGIMAALSFVAYEFFRIPNVLGTGSSFHLGNTFTALTALMLDGVSGGLAGAIGLALADIMAGDPGYAITTFILKFIIGIVCGVFAHKVFKLQDLSATDGVKYYVAVIGSAFSGLLVNVFTDPFLATLPGTERKYHGKTNDPCRDGCKRKNVSGVGAVLCSGAHHRGGSVLYCARLGQHHTAE